MVIIVVNMFIFIVREINRHDEISVIKVEPRQGIIDLVEDIRSSSLSKMAYLIADYLLSFQYLYMTIHVSCRKYLPLTAEIEMEGLANAI